MLLRNFSHLHTYAGTDEDASPFLCILFQPLLGATLEH